MFTDVDMGLKIGSQNRPIFGPIFGPKMGHFGPSGGSRDPHFDHFQPENSDCCPGVAREGSPDGPILSPFWGHFWAPFWARIYTYEPTIWPKMGPKMGPKWGQNRPKIAHFGPFLGHFWTHFGTGPGQNRFGISMKH